MRSKRMSKYLAMLLTVVLVASFVPAPVFAQAASGQDKPQASSITAQEVSKANEPQPAAQSEGASEKEAAKQAVSESADTATEKATDDADAKPADEATAKPGEESAAKADGEAAAKPADETKAEADADDAKAEPAGQQAESAGETPKAENKDNAKKDADKAVEYPAVKLTGQAGGITVTLTAPKGSLPKGTTLSCHLAGQSYIDAVADKLEAQGRTLTDAVAIDVTPLDKDGNEVQPKVPVTVSFSGTGLDLSSDDSVDVYRVSDDAATVTGMGGSGDADNQTFTTDHFTIYVAEGSDGSQSGKGSESNPYVVDYGDTIRLASNFPDNEVAQFELGTWNAYPSSTNYSFDVYSAWLTNKNTSGNYEIVEIHHKYNPSVDHNGDEFFWVKLLPAVQYSVVFYGNAEGVKGLPNAVTVNGKRSGSIEVSLPDTKPEREGYGFNGWAMKTSATSPDASAGGKFTFAVSDADSDHTIELYALWKEAATVEYKAEGHGSVSLASEDADRFAPADLAGATAIPEKGYELEGWYVGDKKVADTDAITSDQVIANMNTREEGGKTAYTDTTFTAKFKPIVYTITYDLNGGTSTGFPTEYTIESREIIILNKPTKEHFDFIGWTGTDLDHPTVYPIIPQGSTGDRHYTATWAVEAFDLRFLCDPTGGMLVIEEDGQVYEDDSIDWFTRYGDPMPKVTARPNEGVKFAGWQNGDKIQLELEPTVTGRATYTALWGYGITYDLDGGSVGGENPTVFSKEYEDITLINPTKPGNKFLGWTGTDLTEPKREVTIDTTHEGDLEYKANWEPELYEVQFQCGVQGNVHGKLGYNGRESQNVGFGQLHYGDAMPAVTPVADQGYEFAGWKKSTAEDPDAVQDALDETVTENVTYTATWKPKEVTYKVNFYYQIPNSKEYKLVKTVTRTGLPEEKALVTDDDRIPQDQGNGCKYEFNLPESDSNKTISGDGSTELNVYFWPKYTITYLAGDHGMLTDAGGEEVDKLTFTGHYGDTVRGATWEKHPNQGYAFDSWDPEVAATVTGNATYTAQWVGDYKVLFDANGGEGTMKYQPFVFDEEQALSKNAFTKKGYEFTGWNTAADGSGTAYGDEDAVVNLADEQGATVTLYAQWKEIETFTITYDLNGGTLDGKTGTITVKAEKGSTISIIGAPTRDGYTFLYWKGSKYQPGDSYTVEADHTFTAQWKKDSSPAKQSSDKEGAKKKSTTKTSATAAKTPKTSTTKTSATAAKTPKTSDENPLVPLGVVMTVSLLGFFFALFKRKQHGARG